MQRVVPSLWFENNAEEATNAYVGMFRNAELLNISYYGEAGPGPAGSVLTTSFRLAGLEFMAINGGPFASYTPAISLTVGCETEQELDDLWAKLAEGGMVLMELAEYPFSPKYGWLQDAFGISWQVTLTGAPQTITPSLMFVGEVHGRAEEAINRYTSLFENAEITGITHYGANDTDPEGTVQYASFTLAGQSFSAMDSAYPHAFTFSPALSLLINCETQEEVDHFWEALGDGGKPNQCGWLDDRFGVTWQVVPVILGEMMRDNDPDRVNRVTAAMLKMIKLDMAQLQAAYDRQK